MIELSRRTALIATLLAMCQPASAADARSGRRVICNVQNRFRATAAPLICLSKAEKIFWLDNDRLLLVACPSKEAPDGPVGIYTYDVTTGATQLHARTHPFWHRLEFHRGNIAFWAEFAELQHQVTWMVGEFGSERVFPGTLEDHSQDIVAAEGPRQLYERVPGLFYNALPWLRLAPAHGRIVAPRNIHAQKSDPAFLPEAPALWHRPDGSVKELPILAKELVGADVSFSVYLDRYVVRPGHSRTAAYSNSSSTPENRGELESARIYFLSTSGEVETKIIPFDRRWRVDRVYPVIEGLAFVSGYDSSTPTLRGSGLWLQRHSGEVMRLSEWPVDGCGVSPDGTRISFSGNSGDYPRDFNVVEVIHLDKPSQNSQRG